jgi:hypothetical protein
MNANQTMVLYQCRFYSTYEATSCERLRNICNKYHGKNKLKEVLPFRSTIPVRIMSTVKACHETQDN